VRRSPNPKKTRCEPPSALSRQPALRGVRLGHPKVDLTETEKFDPVARDLTAWQSTLVELSAESGVDAEAGWHVGGKKTGRLGSTKVAILADGVQDSSQSFGELFCTQQLDIRPLRWDTGSWLRTIAPELPGLRVYGIRPEVALSFISIGKIVDRSPGELILPIQADHFVQQPNSMQAPRSESK